MNLSPSRSLTIALLFCCSFFATNNVLACHVDEPGFDANFRGNVNDQNAEINDYARILADAEDPGCALSADYALTQKISTTPGAFYAKWLSGANVGYIFAAANRIGANGYATMELDDKLQDVIDNWAFVGDPTNCTKESVNQCVDDYAVSAAGPAWIAAYLYRRGDSRAQQYRNEANSLIDQAFNEVCIWNGQDSTLCDGTIQQLHDGAASTLSLNNGQRMPPYGFGLMTSIAMAQLGLQASDAGHTFSSSQVEIAQGLLREMKNSVDAYGNFNNSCETLSFQNGVWVLTPGQNCGGPGQYKPGMYVLHRFYDQQLGGYPAGGYQSDAPNMSNFDISPTSNSWFSWGRYYGYVVMPDEWYQWPAREYLPFDTENPIGFVNGITTDGIVHGWSCDRDVPTKSNRVDVYVGGPPGVGEKFSGYADGISPQQEINQACGGGLAHYFAIQLPSWSHGMSVQTFGDDYTWFGYTELPCLQSPCTW